jgi:hypothetical protein
LAPFERLGVPRDPEGVLPPGLYVIRSTCPRAGLDVALHYRDADDVGAWRSFAATGSAVDSFDVLVNARSGLRDLAITVSSDTRSPLPEGSEIVRLGDPISALEAFAGPPRLPDVLCIGAQRSGTTWLYGALQTHPGIWSKPIKEHHHFDWGGGDDPIGGFRQQQALAILAAHPTASATGDRDALVRMALRHAFPVDAGWPSVTSDFEAAPEGQLVCDATPAYATLDPEVVAEIARTIPRLKVVFVLRDPVERALSGALHALRERSPSSIDEVALREACDAPSNALRTDYVRTLEIWSEHVPEERLFVGFFDDLVRDPVAFVDRVCAFL